jgi:hypothetical protein
VETGGERARRDSEEAESESAARGRQGKGSVQLIDLDVVDADGPLGHWDA